MKGLLVMLLFSLAVTMSGGREKYSVFKVSGQVERYAGAEWCAVERRDSLSLKDRLRLAADSRIGILDNSSGRIYYSDNVGEQSVAAIIVSAKRSSDAVTGQVNRQIRQAMGEGRSSDYSYTAVGASRRGESEAGVTARIYGVIADVLGTGCIQAEDSVRLGKHPAGDGAFSFIVENGTDKTLCVNVLAVSGHRKPMLCFNVGYSCDEPYVLVPPHSEQAVSQFVFAEIPDDGTEYLLFASEELYDIQELQMLLNTSATPQPSDSTVKVMFARLE